MTCKWKELKTPPAPLKSIAQMQWEDLAEESQLTGLTGDPNSTTDFLVASIPNDRLYTVKIALFDSKVYLWCESAEGDWYLYVYSCGLSSKILLFGAGAILAIGGILYATSQTRPRRRLKR